MNNEVVVSDFGMERATLSEMDCCVRRHPPARTRSLYVVELLPPELERQHASVTALICEKAVHLRTFSRLVEVGFREEFSRHRSEIPVNEERCLR